MVHGKYHAPQHHLGKHFHMCLLKPDHKMWKVNVRDASKMINDGDHPKALHFRQGMLENLINAFKSFLSEKNQRS